MWPVADTATMHARAGQSTHRAGQVGVQMPPRAVRQLAEQRRGHLLRRQEPAERRAIQHHGGARGTIACASRDVYIYSVMLQLGQAQTSDSLTS